MSATDSQASSTDDEIAEAIPLAGMRGIIARRLTQSLQEMAQLTLHRQVEVQRLVAYRASLEPESRPSLNHLILAATTRALIRHPSLNATLENETILRWRRVHLGMAVAVQDGLVVPVIHGAEQLSIDELRARADDLSARARAGSLAMADLHPATFTVSNLGSFGIDAFTPIVNPPQVAILGVGRIVGDKMALSLTIDHRALDGVPGARFLEELAELFLVPETLL